MLGRAQFLAALPLIGAAAAIPPAGIAQEADELARSALPGSLYNHSLRTYLFAALIAQRERVSFDRDILFVASILHDTGLAPGYISAGNRFEIDSALVARRLLQRHGASSREVRMVWDAITLHDSELALWKDAEVVLVHRGVNADFGAGIDALDRTEVAAVLRAAPRTNFIPEFLGAVAEIGKKKPGETGKCFVTDVASRMVPGFHLPNFCDTVREDPFAGY